MNEMPKNAVCVAVLALFAADGGTAAGYKPWASTKPEGTTAEHFESAVAAREVEARMPAGGFGYDPLRADWDWSGGRNRSVPMSNMTSAALRNLIAGRYHVLAAAEGGTTPSAPGSGAWSARYYAPDGRTHFCEYDETLGRHVERTLDRYVASAPFGLAGLFHWDPVLEAAPKPPPEESVGWPLVADGDSGFVHAFYWDGQRWVPESGWVQDAYAAAFAVECPSLPRAGETKHSQTGESLAQLRTGARPVRGFPTAFRNDPRDPMTASMYFWFNPPE